MQNRQKHEIVRDILTVCNGGNVISRIMFHAYITHTQAKGYLGELIQTGLIEGSRLDKKYYTTAKGLEYLTALDSMSDMLSIQTRKVVVLNH
jgi:predicted transcriptional regulator